MSVCSNEAERSLRFVKAPAVGVSGLGYRSLLRTNNGSPTASYSSSHPLMPPTDHDPGSHEGQGITSVVEQYADGHGQLQ